MMTFADRFWNVYATFIAFWLAFLLRAAVNTARIDPTATREEWLLLCDQAWRATK